MKEHRSFLAILPALLILTLFMSACSPLGGGAGATATPTATGGQNVQPQTTPTPKSPVAGQPSGSGNKVGGKPLPQNELKPLVFALAYNDAAMDADVAQMYTPGSPTFHKYMTTDQIIQRYALPADKIQQVQEWLTQNGYTVLEVDQLHSAIKVQASVAAIQKSLGIQLKAYTLPILNREFFMQEGEPKLPANIAPLVQSIIGLDNFALPEFKPPFTMAHGTAIDSANCTKYGAKQTLTSKKLAAAYQIDKLHQQNLLGQGMTIGVAEFGDPYDPADINNYAACAGIPQPQIENVDVDGRLQSAPGEGEAAMDIELIAGLAPQAKILVYQTPGNSFAQEMVDLLNRVAADHRVQVLSISYGTGEDMFSTSEMAAVNRSLRTLAAAGISVFISSGDCGAYSMRLPNLAVVAFPASAPYAISVGGTHLQVNDANVRTSETVWGANDGTPLCQNQWGSGGGVSQNQTFKRPTWQVGQGTTAKYNGSDAGVAKWGTFPPEPVVAPNGLRQVPDIAAAGYPNIAIYHKGLWIASGGTSASAPIVAAGTLLVDQALQQQGKASLGSVPEFYSLANHSGNFHPYTDIVSGNNLFYPATRGWDYATGWGAPNFFDILQIEQAG